MDTKMPNAKLDPELVRYQKVLDAYHAFPGDSPEPPGSLDQRILMRAQTALTPAKPAKTSVLRRWPIAIAASVATIGFAAILARHSLREPPPSFDSAPAMRQSQETQSSLPPAKALEPDQGSAAGLHSTSSASNSSEPARADSVPVSAAAAPELAAKRAPTAPVAAQPQIVAPISEPSAKPAATIANEGAKADALELGRAYPKHAVQEPLNEEAELVSEPASDSAPMPSTSAPAPAMAMPAAAPVLAESKESADTDVATSETSSNAAAGAVESVLTASDQPMRDEKPDDAVNSRARSAKREALDLTTQSDADETLFKHIRELRAQGKDEQARTLLLQFQQANPDKAIPQDLKDLLQE